MPRFCEAYAKFLQEHVCRAEESHAGTVWLQSRSGFRPLVMSVTVMWFRAENFNSVQVNSLAVAVVELLPLAGILFWLQQVRLKNPAAYQKQEQLLYMKILLLIGVEVIVSTHTLRRRRHAVQVPRSVRCERLHGTEMTTTEFWVDYLSGRL